MITITDKTNCCGCQACANICPKSCISMQADDEGFLYPHVDKDICVSCGLCEKVCPILHKPQTFLVLETYAAKHDNTEVKMKSSSGGMFSAIAEEILKEGGVVFGAAFDKEWNVVHTYVEKLEDLDKLRRSKYVQSNISQTYQQAKQFLEQNRKVFFTGTPCQIAGLRNYLGKKYDNLLTAELFCHGVPSPAVWQKFLQENTPRKQIARIDFRHKRFGWDAYFLNITLKDGTQLPHTPHWLSPVLNYKKGKLFRHFYHLTYSISNLYERPSCHACHFKGLTKIADFTIGDLWGIQRSYPQFYDVQGVSALLVNTPKAQKQLEKLSLQLNIIDIGQVVAFNPYLIASVKSHPKREEFFTRFQTEDFNKLIRELSNTTPFLLEVTQKIYRYIFRHKRP